MNYSLIYYRYYVSGIIQEYRSPSLHQSRSESWSGGSESWSGEQEWWETIRIWGLKRSRSIFLTIIIKNRREIHTARTYILIIFNYRMKLSLSERSKSLFHSFDFQGQWTYQYRFGFALFG